MAFQKHFAEVGNETVRFERVGMLPIDCGGKNSGGVSRKMTLFGWHAESQLWIKIERTINMKSSPSKHECDARCINATGRTMQCECSCGGKNHGRGAFNCSPIN